MTDQNGYGKNCSECDPIYLGPCKYHRSLSVLGINEDQLRIAKALDQEKVEFIKQALYSVEGDYIAQAVSMFPGSVLDRIHRAALLLPTFKAKNEKA